jgi:hypothetical protein
LIQKIYLGVGVVLTADEARAMADAVKKAGVKAMGTFNYRFVPANRQALGFAKPQVDVAGLQEARRRNARLGLVDFDHVDPAGRIGFGPNLRQRHRRVLAPAEFSLPLVLDIDRLFMDPIGVHVRVVPPDLGFDLFYRLNRAQDLAVRSHRPRGVLQGLRRRLADRVRELALVGDRIPPARIAAVGLHAVGERRAKPAARRLADCRRGHQQRDVDARVLVHRGPVLVEGAAVHRQRLPAAGLIFSQRGLVLFAKVAAKDRGEVETSHVQTPAAASAPRV